VSCVLDLSFLLSKIFCTWQSESCLKSFALQSSLIFLFFDILEQFPFERSASPLGRDFVFNSLFFSFSFSAFVSCYLCLETWFSASFLPSIDVSSHSSFFFFLYFFCGGFKFYLFDLRWQTQHSLLVSTETLYLESRVVEAFFLFACEGLG